MQRETMTMDVRPAGEGVAIVDITGEITSASEPALMDAFARATGEDTRAVILDFTGLEYMNSGGIGLLVTMLVRANRQRQRLMALGLTDHYRQIFSLTRLDEAIGVFDTEEQALAALEG
jgi:anti-sigma B factor antagonist